MKNLILLLSVIALFAVAGCDKDDPTPPADLPVVTTNAIADITDTSATVGGNVSTAGSSAVTSRGVAYNITHDPTIGQYFLADAGTGTGSFSFTMIGIPPATTLYVRAYATNSSGTAYGNEVAFTTTSGGGGGGGCNVIQIGSPHNLTTATTWHKGNVYVIEGGLSVDAQLTIEAGTVIKFKDSYGMRTTGSGSIQAVGTAAEPIIFTTYTDDNYCGDSNGDGSATTPTKGFWGGIRLQATVPSNLTYCSVLYAGSSAANAAGYEQAISVALQSDGSTFDHCTIAHTSGFSNITRGAVQFAEVYNCVFTNNMFYDNAAPIVANWCASANFIAASNVFHNPADPSQKNILQGIFLDGNNSGFVRNTHLDVTEVAYVMDGINGSSISSGITVTFADNVIMKFKPGAQFSINSTNGDNTVNGQGTGVFYTSFKDDIGGDSNGDGNSTSPGSTDWKGIKDSNGGIWMSWSNILYKLY